MGFSGSSFWPGELSNSEEPATAVADEDLGKAEVRIVLRAAFPDGAGHALLEQDGLGELAGVLRRGLNHSTGAGPGEGLSQGNLDGSATEEEDAEGVEDDGVFSEKRGQSRGVAGIEDRNILLIELLQVRLHCRGQGPGTWNLKGHSGEFATMGAKSRVAWL